MRVFITISFRQYLSAISSPWLPLAFSLYHFHHLSHLQLLHFWLFLPQLDLQEKDQMKVV